MTHATSDFFGVSTSEPDDEGIYEIEVIVTQDDGTGILLQADITFSLEIACPKNGCDYGFKQPVSPIFTKLNEGELDYTLNPTRITADISIPLPEAVA